MAYGYAAMLPTSFTLHGLRGLRGTCPSASVTSQAKTLSYCPGPGGVVVPCAGQDILGTQAYNNQLQEDANNALNQCNCNNAWVLNGSVGVNQCAQMYPVSGTTSVPQPVAPTTPVTSVAPTPASTPNTTQQTTANQGGATNSSPSGSTNASEQSGAAITIGGVGLSGLEIIIGVVSVGLALFALNSRN